MKKIFLIMAFTFGVITMFAAAEPTELWNGFTDAMTVSQVTSRADKLLNNKSYTLYKEALEYGGFQHIPTTIAGILPHPDKIIIYRSPNKEFEQDPYKLGQVQNIWFYFFNNKLYGIEISWNMDIKESVIEKGIINYGSDYTIKKNTSSYNTWNFYTNIAYCWNKNDKQVYIYNTNPNGQCYGIREQIQLFVFSKSGIKQYESDLKAREETERQQAEENHKSTVDKIKF